jgi:hypothetical protein
MSTISGHASVYVPAAAGGTALPWINATNCLFVDLGQAGAGPAAGDVWVVWATSLPTLTVGTGYGTGFFTALGAGAWVFTVTTAGTISMTVASGSILVHKIAPSSVYFESGCF